MAPRPSWSETIDCPQPREVVYPGCLYAGASGPPADEGGCPREVVSRIFSCLVIWVMIYMARAGQTLREGVADLILAGLPREIKVCRACVRHTASRLEKVITRSRHAPKG